MKYAFIILIALYLLVYGCGPDNSKKADKKSHATQSTVEKTVKPTQPKAVNIQPEPTVIKAPQPAQQTPALPSNPSTTDAEKAPAAAEANTDDAIVRGLQQPPCKGLIEQQGAIELTQPDDENIVVMPCGCIFNKKRIPNNAPCLKGLFTPCPMMNDNLPEIEDNLIELPCGHVFLRQPIAEDETAIGAQQQPKAHCRMEAQPQDIDESEQDFDFAIEKMVKTTNDMVLVTKQLVIATQEMLKATKGITLEMTNQASNANANRAAVDTPARQPTIGEQEVANALKEAIIATQKAIDVINQATSGTIEPKQK